MTDKELIKQRINDLGEDFIKQLDIIAVKFKEQHDKFIDETNGENFFQIILRAHLYIEYEMKEMLKIKLQHPEELGDQSRFASTLKILLAIGAIPLELKNPINFLNRIRNNYAHDLNYQFNEETYNKFINSFSEEFKANYKEKYKESLVVRLRELLITLWLLLIELRLINDEVKTELNNIFS